MSCLFSFLIYDRRNFSHDSCLSAREVSARRQTREKGNDQNDLRCLFRPFTGKIKWHWTCATFSFLTSFHCQLFPHKHTAHSAKRQHNSTKINNSLISSPFLYRTSSDCAIFLLHGKFLMRTQFGATEKDSFSILREILMHSAFLFIYIHSTELFSLHIFFSGKES